MTKNKIYLSPPHLTGEEQKYVQQAFQENWVAPVGPQINLFEEKIASYLGVDHVVALNSATAALHLGLKALGVEKGDLVLCPTFSFIATANPIQYLGATPVFVDSEKETWNMCPVLLEKAIKDLQQKPKVLILSHVYGAIGKVEALLSIAKKYQIAVLEDAAPALGAESRGKKAGTFGDVGVISFNGNKIVTTSGGGVLVTNNKEIAEKVLSWSIQSKDDSGDFVHEDIGYNYRMSNISAAIGCGQLEVLENRLVSKKKIHDYYQNNLEQFFVYQNRNSNYWLTTVLFETSSLRQKVKRGLLESNIEVRDLWYPIHLQKPYVGSLIYTNGVAENLNERGLTLPSGTNLTEGNLNSVIDTIKKML